MPQRSDRQRPRMILAFVLTALAGFADAAGYIGLDRIYAANMSGNTVTAAVDGLRGRDPFYALTAIGCFIIGVVVASTVLEAGRVKGRSLRAVIYLIEGLLLLTFMLRAHHLLSGVEQRIPHQPVRHYHLVALIAAAMGLQNASLTKVGEMTVFTTHVTGTLTKSAQSFGEWLVDSFSGTRSFKSALTAKGLWTAVLFAGLFLSFACGGVVGAWAELKFGLDCLIAVVGALGLLTVEELWRTRTWR